MVYPNFYPIVYFQLILFLFHPNDDSVLCTTFYNENPFLSDSNNGTAKYFASKIGQLSVATGGSTDGEKCTSEQFQCGEKSTKNPSGGKCIPKRWQCDYHRDCENGEDEIDCRKLSLNHLYILV